MTKKQTWIGIAISAFFLYLAFRNSNWSDIYARIRAVNVWWLLLFSALTIFSIYLRAIHWRYLLLPSGRPSLHSLFGATMIGFMSLNLLYPCGWVNLSGLTS